MSRLWFKFVVASVVTGGLYLAVTAQEPGAPGGKEKPPMERGKKAKLFEGPLFGGKNAPGGIFEALKDKRVQEELELADFQVTQLQALAAALTADLGPRMEELKTLPKEEQNVAMEDLRKEMATRLTQLQGEIETILLPHQQQRLRQVALQQRMQKAGTAEALLSPELASEFRLTEAQVTQIREGIAKIEEEYRVKAQKLREEMRDKIIVQFPFQHRERLKTMIGAQLADKPKPRGATKVKRLPGGD